MSLLVSQPLPFVALQVPCLSPKNNIMNLHYKEEDKMSTEMHSSFVNCDCENRMVIHFDALI